MPEFQKPEGVEVRVAADTWPAADLSIRADGDGMTFNGYAAVFNSPSEPLPWRETIRPGAFKRSLKNGGNIRMFLNHNTDKVLGSTKAKTLRLAEDEVGLHVEADLPDTNDGRDLATLMRRGDVDSMSFGFQVIKDAWNNDYTERELIEVRLFEVSPITSWPAYPATSAFVRHLSELAEVEAEPLSDALRVLVTEGAELTEEQYDVLVQAINARTSRTLILPEVAAVVRRATEHLEELKFHEVQRGAA